MDVLCHPYHRQARLGEGLYVGHALATYTLEKHFSSSDKGTTPESTHGSMTWQNIIAECLSSTSKALPVRWTCDVI